MANSEAFKGATHAVIGIRTQDTHRSSQVLIHLFITGDGPGHAVVIDTGVHPSLEGPGDLVQTMVQAGDILFEQMGITPDQVLFTREAHEFLFDPSEEYTPLEWPDLVHLVHSEQI